MEVINFNIIGRVNSCFKEKFGIPRQPGLVSHATAQIEILPPYNRPEAFRGLENYSHLWIMFIFHASMRDDWKATVRPPKMGGNTRIGVFATRSNFRPNPVGLSVVKLEKVVNKGGKMFLEVSGGDFLDQTPIIDIKPYLSYADSIPDANIGYSCPEVPSKNIAFSQESQNTLNAVSKKYPNLQDLITQILVNDPRPGYHKKMALDRVFGCRLYEFNIRWHHPDENTIEVIGIDTPET